MKIEAQLRTKKFASVHDRAVVSTMFTGNWLADNVNGILKPWGISEQQYNVLRILRGQKGQPVNLFVIQERMIHRMSNATRLVEKLRQKGLVKREICESNRRMVEITITSTGNDLLLELDQALEEYRDSIKRKLTIEEAKLLGDLLDKIRE